ncbi:MAG TPA: 16S rRNA (guanine(966)-N(2))-methyltransferase RsmD [Lichenihabitans sp.]|nr:16S rRNA (guanine(966)-N(2))-methyltransferase RsmD [Lichenihabitans sp.]
MRIIGGTFKGRSLRGPSSASIRPTADRLREALFNILAHAYGDPVAGARVIDLFAGTGALGLEALSRGAAFALFVEDGAEARALIRENVEALGVAGLCRIFRRDATKLGAAAVEPFGLAFLDPPYGRDLGPAALAALAGGGWLTAGALCILEEAGAADITPPDGYALIDRRTTSDTQLAVLRYRGA